MPLPYRVDTLDDVPEALREHYEQDGDGYRLPVQGVKTEDDIRGLESALDKIKRERNELRDKASRVSDDDLEDLARLRKESKERDERKAKEEGRWEELRAKLLEEKEGEIGKIKDRLTQREQVIETLTVVNELRAAIAASGVLPEYYEAVEAVLQRKGPKVTWKDGEMPKGVFPDEVHGDQPVAAFVEEWSKTDAAKAYMPKKVAGGGGGVGRDAGELPKGPYDRKLPIEDKVALIGQKYAS